MRKTPQFQDFFFSRTRSFARARWGAGRGRERRDMDVPPDETEDAETEHALYECALAELLAEGVAEDVRPLLQKFQ